MYLYTTQRHGRTQHICITVYKYVCIYTYMYTCIRIYTTIHIYIYVYVYHTETWSDTAWPHNCRYTYMYIYVYMYIHMYIHNYIYIHMYCIQHRDLAQHSIPGILRHGHTKYTISRHMPVWIHIYIYICIRIQHTNKQKQKKSIPPLDICLSEYTYIYICICIQHRNLVQHSILGMLRHGRTQHTSSRKL